jgi:hypothetical protein
MLNVVVQADAFGSTLNLSLLRTTEQSIQMAGVLVAAQGDLLLSSSLEVSSDAGLEGVLIDNHGVFTAVSDGEQENFEYTLEPLVITTTTNQFTLWHGSITDTARDVRYQSFALEDPFPLLILPIVGAVVGVSWLWQRHANQDKSAGQVIKDTVEQARVEDRPVRVVQESDSEVSFFGIRFKARSKFEADIGEPRRQEPRRQE